jgi:hypothetical protein
MHRLIYISTATDWVAAQDISDILSEAIATNTERNITGILLYNGLNFLQLLEGERRDVEAVFGKIVTDRRHVSVVTVLSEPADARIFGNWAMLLKTREATAIPGGQASSDFGDVLDAAMPGHVRHILLNFDTLKG